MDVFLGKVCYAENPINTLLTKIPGYAAGYELCDPVDHYHVTYSRPPLTNL